MEFFGYRRRDARPEVVAANPVGPPDRRDAFAAGLMQGRQEERSRRRSHPLLTLLVAAVALAGVAMLALAAREGSFSRGGAVVDHSLTTAADTAVAKTGQAIQSAGERLQETASGAPPATP